MNKKPLLIILIALLVALMLSPLLTSSAMAQEADEIQGMRKALNSTVKQCGLSVYQGLEGDAGIYYYFARNTDFGQYTYVGIDIQIFPSAEDAEDEYEMYGWIHSPVGTRKVTSFHGYPAETAYSISEPVWFEKTKTWEGYHSENYSLFWRSDNYLFEIVVDTGDPETSAENLGQNVAEVLFSNMQEQGLLAEGKPPEPENQPPNASFSIFPPSPTPDDPVVGVSTSTDPDGDPLTYKWYLDGKHMGNFPSCEPGKLEAGKHTITLHVNDGRGGTDEYSQTIVVEAPQIATEVEQIKARLAEWYNFVINGSEAKWTAHQLHLLEEVLRALPYDYFMGCDIKEIQRLTLYIEDGKQDPDVLGVANLNTHVIRLFDEAHTANGDFNDSDKNFKGTLFHELTHLFQTIDPATGKRYNAKDTDDNPLMKDWGKLSGWVYGRKGNKVGWFYGLVLDPETKKLVGAPEKAKFITNYADTDPYEDMAESVMMYFIDPDKLKKECPEKYKFIKDRIFKGKL